MKIEDVKTVNQWIAINKPKGCLSLNVDLLREYKDISAEFSKLNTLLYVLLVDLKQSEFQCLFKSSVKTKNYVDLVCLNLKNYQAQKRFEKMFTDNIKTLRKRIAHINKIVKINLRLSDLYPYFEHNGYDILDDPDILKQSWDAENKCFNDGGRTKIIESIKKWNEENPDIIAKHMEEIRPELEAANRRRQEIVDNAKAEKKRIKEEKKKEEAEYKEIKKNEAEYKKHMRKVNREFETYYFQTRMQEAYYE